MPGSRRTVVHVLACLKRRCTLKFSEVEAMVLEHVARSEPLFLAELPLPFAHVPALLDCLESLAVADTLECATQAADASVRVEVYQLSEDTPFIEQSNDYEVGDTEADTPACEVTPLPNRVFHHLWESLIYESSLKRDLLQYVETAMLFTDRSVDNTLITFNRVLLLHGPPGTGKTSICKALAQRVAIRMGQRFQGCSLVEINAHSLFSKWFSESGKLVGKIFTRIREMVEDETSLCFILIDEVESLAAARKSALSGAEPSDALRVVNALLTQLDTLRRFSNVFVMATSNITEAIDVAFVDRADLKLYVGPPSCAARYSILRGAVHEMVRKGLIGPSAPLPPTPPPQTPPDLMDGLEEHGPEHLLRTVAQQCEGMSGRMLRKLPFLAFAPFVQGQEIPCTITAFLLALQDMAHRQRAAAAALTNA